MEQKKIKSKKENKSIFIGAALAVLAVIAITVNIPFTTEEKYNVNESITRQVPYIATELKQELRTENYSVSEPYTLTEYYEEKLPYPETRFVRKNLSHNIVLRSCDRNPDTSEVKATVAVNNFDNEDGIFRVWVGFILPNGNSTGKEFEKYLYAATSAEFTVSTPVKGSVCAYEAILVPSRLVPETYNTTLKARDVTKFQDVEHSEEMTIYRPVKVTKFTEVIETKEVTKTREVNLSLIERLLRS